MRRHGRGEENKLLHLLPRDCVIHNMSRPLALAFVSALLGLTSLALAQAEKPSPNFEDFPAPHVYQGQPAAPILSKSQRFFRTRIREGAKSPVRFGGHYTLPTWGCGEGCITFDLVDSITGKVQDGLVIVLPLDWLDEHPDENPKPLEYRPTSRLLKINGCLGEAGPCGFFDYEMVDGKGLRLIHKELLPDKYQFKPQTN